MKAGERAEGALAPDVEAAFFGVARRQLEHGEHQRHEEAERRRHPDDDGAWSRRRRRGHPPEAECRDDVEQQEVGEAEGAAKLRSGEFAAASPGGRIRQILRLEPTGTDAR